MRTLNAGVWVLTVWAALNLLVAAGVSVALLSGANAPALGMAFSPAEATALDPRSVAVVNGLASLANPCIVALCLLVLALVWKGVRTGQTWALWALVAALVPLQAFAFFSDTFFRNQNVVANLVSTALVALGLGLSGHGLRAAR